MAVEQNVGSADLLLIQGLFPKLVIAVNEHLWPEEGQERVMREAIERAGQVASGLGYMGFRIAVGVTAEFNNSELQDVFLKSYAKDSIGRGQRVFLPESVQGSDEALVGYLRRRLDSVLEQRKLSGA